MSIETPCPSLKAIFSYSISKILLQYVQRHQLPILTYSNQYRDTNDQFWHFQIGTKIPITNPDIFKSVLGRTGTNQTDSHAAVLAALLHFRESEEGTKICGRLDAMFESNWRENRSVANLMLESWRGRGNDKKLRICHKFAAFDIAWSKLSFLSVTFIHSRFKISNSIH